MKRFIYIPLILLLLASCSTPKAIIKLKPQSDKTTWFYGQEFTGDSVFGIVAKIAFDQIENPWYTFDLEITNRSNMDFLVDPSTMFVVPLDAYNKPLGTDTIYAVDPEQKIGEFDRNISINAAKRKNQWGLSLLAAGIDIATGIAVLTDDNPRNDNLRTDLLPLALANGVENKFEAIDLNQLRDIWKQTTLRKTTLEKGFTLHGKLLVPIVPKASYLQFNIPVDNELIRINFMQVKIAP